MWLYELCNFRLSNIKSSLPFIEGKLLSFTCGLSYYGLNTPMTMYFVTELLLDIRDIVHHGGVLVECKGGIHAYLCQNLM